MFKSLQARLTLSYVIILFVCLVLVGAAASILLRGYQRNLTFTRLQDGSALAAPLLNAALRRGETADEAIARLGQQMNRGDGKAMVLYLLDADGTVVAASRQGLIGQRFDNLALREVPASDWPVRGERRLPGSERLLYVADPVRPIAGGEQPAARQVLVLATPFRPARLALGDLLSRLAWAGVVALALSIVLAAVMAYSIARPLDRIAQAAEEISDGNYGQELSISSPTEVARLATSFNRMARQVEATLQSQQDLVANVSHDLKTPLTSIQGFSQALVDGTARDDAARKRAATVIHAEAGRMRRLIDDLLDLARLEAGQVALARAPVDLEGLMRRCADRFAPQSEQAGVRLEVEAVRPLPPVVGDADRLEQVLGNLVDNALKHASGGAGGGRVVLRAEQQGDWLACSVTDNGPGMPAGELERVFERFYQVDKARAGDRRGSGLGLAIAREVVEAHGGAIRAESVEGLGTRLAFTLPLAVGL